MFLMTFITGLIRPKLSNLGPGPNLDIKGLNSPIYLQMKGDYAHSPFSCRDFLGRRSMCAIPLHENTLRWRTSCGIGFILDKLSGLD